MATKTPLCECTRKGCPCDHGIGIGDRVRSYDFDHNRFNEGPSACYVEGIVTNIAPIRGCQRYLIVVEKRMFQGELDDEGERLVLPPVNGTTRLFGDETDGVQLLQRNVLEVG